MAGNIFLIIYSFVKWKLLKQNWGCFTDWYFTVGLIQHHEIHYFCFQLLKYIWLDSQKSFNKTYNLILLVNVLIFHYNCLQGVEDDGIPGHFTYFMDQWISRLNQPQLHWSAGISFLKPSFSPFEPINIITFYLLKFKHLEETLVECKSQHFVRMKQWFWIKSIKKRTVCIWWKIKFVLDFNQIDLK